MKLDTRSPLPMARPTAVGHPFHGLVKQGLTLPNGRVVPYSVLGISTKLQVPGWDGQEQYDPVTGYRWLPYAIYQRYKFFDGCYLYGQFINNCDWLVAFGVADIWAVAITASGLDLKCLNRPGSKSFPLNWGPVADAFQPKSGWDRRLAAVSISGNSAAMTFVRGSTLISASLAVSENNAAIQFTTHQNQIPWPGYEWIRTTTTQLVAATRAVGTAVSTCGMTVLSVSESSVGGGGRKVTALGEHRVGNVPLGRFRSSQYFDMPPGPVPNDDADIPHGVLQKPGFVWLVHPMYTPIDDGAVVVNGYVPSTGLFTPYGVVDIVSGNGTLWDGPADNHVAIHPVTRQVVFDSQPICFA
ncbi:hypothetical protein [Chromobacterium haemolyticum]|uniref:hypothetical protein n=1 Tax=Chromobacterium haemolyticum TaxID=394935 RepID=UPI0011309340|nr:hypothetical protein [Chromobacterium haemolyticum]